MASREIIMLARPGIRTIGRYRAPIKEAIRDVATLAGAGVTNFEVHEKLKDKWDSKKGHTELEAKEVKVDEDKHDAPWKTNEVVVTTSAHQHHSSMFSELDLKQLPHSRTIHLIEVVGGIERAFEVEINILKEVDLREVVGQEEVLDEVTCTV